MAKNIFKIFIKGFLQAILILASMILCGVGGFFGTRYYYTKKTNKENATKIASMIGDAQIDDVSKNLIYVWNEDKGRISSCLLEVFDTQNNKMTYITIPTSGQVTIPAQMYKKICMVNQEIPQVFSIAKLCQYFDEGDDTAFGYGVLILEEYFNIDISYYTVVPTDVFDEMFENREVDIDQKGAIKGENYASIDKVDSSEKKDEGEDPFAHDDSFVTTDNYADSTTEEPASSGGTASSEENTTEEVMPDTTSVKVRMVREDYFQKVEEYLKDSDLNTYVSEQCARVRSNLDVSDKLSYVEKYQLLTKEDYMYYCIPGKYDGKTYVFYEDNASKLFRKCNVNEVPSENEDEEDENEGLQSELFNLVILNSTQTAGVAANWSEEFTARGYNVKEVGNYSPQLTDTLIIVKEEGQGEEFLRFFTNASIEVGDVPSGADAKIIIGSNDIK